MAKNDIFSNPTNIINSVSKNTVITGNIDGEGNIKIEGTVKGNISTNGDLFIMDGSIITGNISANNIYTAGTVSGNVKSKGVLQITSNAKLQGDVVVCALIAESGSIFKGKCIMAELPPTIPAKNPSKSSI